MQILNSKINCPWTKYIVCSRFFLSFFQFHETNNFGNLFEILKIEFANRWDKFLESPGLLRISELSPISTEHENH